MGNLTVKESGEMAPFISPNVSKITSFKVHFSPKQEGTGDPSPENVREITGWNGVEGYGSGKNLAHIFGYGTQTIPDTDVNKYKITNAYGTTINTTIFNNPDTPLIIEQSQAPDSTAPSSYHNGYIVIGTNNLVFGQKYNVSFKVSNITNNILNINLNKMRLLVPTGTFTGVTEIIDDVLIFKNVTFYQSTIAPKRQSFEIRICGLSFTLSEFMVTAVDNDDFTYEPFQGNIYSKEWTKNLLDIWEKPNGYKPSSRVNGNYNWSKEWIVTDELKGKTITYSTFIDNTNANDNGYVHIWTKNSEDNYIKTNITPSSNKQIVAGESGWSYVNLILTDDIYSVIFGITVSANAIAKYPMVELGSEPTEYQPYVGNVYGGYVDWVSGELVADRAVKTFDGSETWNIATVSSKTAYQTRRPADIASGAVFTSNIITRVASLSGTVPNNVGYFGGTYLNVYAPSLSLEEWTAMLTATPLQIVYKLAEPITHQLTPQQLSTLKGQNNFWSNADYVEIEYELTETFDIQKAKRKIILNQPHVESTSGDLITFDTDMRGKLKECKVYFSPVQEGEGDPSPDNVRNIVGWNGITATRSGKNLIDKTAYENIYTTYDYIDSSYRCKKIQLKPNTTYTVSFTSTGADANVIILFNYTSHVNGNTFLDLRKASGSKTYTTDDIGCLYIGSVNTNNDKYNARMSVCEIQIEEGLTATDYEPYTGQTYPITFPTEAGTIYGGYIDLVSGELVTDRAIKTFDGSENWGVYSPDNYDSYCFTLDISDKKIKQETTICNKYKNVRVAWGADGNGKFGVFSDHVYLGRLYFTRPNETFEKDKTVWKTWLAENSIQICYELAEPIHYQLIPQQLLTLKGTNNVYSDTNGQMEIKYWKH